MLWPHVFFPCYILQVVLMTKLKFEEVIEDHLSRDLRIPDLCAHLGISQRTLEYFCSDFYGMSPRRYLTLRRLNSVRDRLLQGVADGESIAGKSFPILKWVWRGAEGVFCQPVFKVRPWMVLKSFWRAFCSWSAAWLSLIWWASVLSISKLMPGFK